MRDENGDPTSLAKVIGFAVMFGIGWLISETLAPDVRSHVLLSPPPCQPINATHAYCPHRFNGE